LQRTQQFAERNLAFPAHDVVHIHSHVGFVGETGVIAAHHHLHAGLEGTHQVDDAGGGAALESHHGEPNNLWVKLVKQPVDSLPHPTIAEDQIRHSNSVVAIHISR